MQLMGMKISAIHIMGFWVVTQCSVVYEYLHFGGIYWFCLQGSNWNIDTNLPNYTV